MSHSQKWRFEIEHIGFTGTQRGMTTSQKDALYMLLVLEHGIGHHGDCIGGDAEFHDIVSDFNWKTIIHPPIILDKRAWKTATEEMPPKNYIQRNHEIVDSVTKMFACPKEQFEILRSGTWATIRYAKKQGVPLTIVYPDGSVREY